MILPDCSYPSGGSLVQPREYCVPRAKATDGKGVCHLPLRLSIADIIR